MSKEDRQDQAVQADQPRDAMRELPPSRSANEVANRLVQNFFREMDADNTPRYDFELGQYTDDYRDNSAAVDQAEQRIVDFVAANRERITDSKILADWYRDERVSEDELDLGY